MATIGDLVVKLGLDRSRFDSGINRATQKMGRLESRSVVLGRALRGVLATGLATVTAAATAAAAAFAAMIKNSFQLGDQLGKLSDRLGITTQALGGLQHAAGLSGVGIDELGTGLRQMLRNVSDASRGIGEAVDAFEQLGLRADQLRLLSPEDQFLAIAHALEGITNEADRVAIAMDIFGRSGTGLLSLLDDGAAGIQEMVREFHELGGAMSRLDVSKLEEANDAAEKLDVALQGLANTFAQRMAPGITRVSGLLTELIKLFRTLTDFSRGNVDIFGGIAKPPTDKDLSGLLDGKLPPREIPPLGDPFKGKRGRGLPGAPGAKGKEGVASKLAGLADVDRTDPGLASGALRGSRAAANAIARFTRGGTVEDKQLKVQQSIQTNTDKTVQAVQQLGRGQQPVIVGLKGA